MRSDKSQSDIRHPFAVSNIDKRSLTAHSEQKSSNIKSSRSEVIVPEHLTDIYERLDWHGQDLDALIIATKLSAPQLIGQLMELELMGVISVQGGRYLRV